MHASQAEIGEALPVGQLAEVVEEGLIPGDVLSPDDRVPHDEGVIAGRGHTRIAVVVPIVFAQIEWNVIVGFRSELLHAMPDGRDGQEQGGGDQSCGQPMTGGQT